MVRICFAIVVCITCCTATCMAQKQLSPEETQNFYKLVRQTKEFKTVKQQTDSVNKAQDKSKVPQEINLKILTKEPNTSDDDPFFDCTLDRSLAIGILIERYVFRYDKNKKQIVSVRHDKGHFQAQ